MGVGFNGFFGHCGWGVGIGGDFRYLKKVELAVVGDGFWDAVFVEVGEGKDAGFFKGGVFGFQKVEAGFLNWRDFGGWSFCWSVAWGGCFGFGWG